MSKPKIMNQLDRRSPRASQHARPAPAPRTQRDESDLPLWARRTLRRGLPGDARPRTEQEARHRCPHVVLRSKLNPGYRRNTFVVATWRERPEGHRCFGGWML